MLYIVHSTYFGLNFVKQTNKTLNNNSRICCQEFVIKFQLSRIERALGDKSVNEISYAFVISIWKFDLVYKRVYATLCSSTVYELAVMECENCQNNSLVTRVMMTIYRDSYGKLVS